MIEKITTTFEAVEWLNSHGYKARLSAMFDEVAVSYHGTAHLLSPTLVLGAVNVLSGYYDSVEAEHNALQSQVERQRPVMEAAIDLRESGSLDSDYQPDVRLMITVDAFKKKSGD